MKTKITSILPIFLVLLLIYNNLYSQIGFPIRQQVIYDGYTSDYDVYHLTIENKECSTCYEYNFDIRNEFNKKYERFNSKAYIEVLIRFKNKLVLIKKVNFTKYSGTNPYTNINYKGIIDLKNINDSNFAMDKNPYIVYSIRVIKIITCPFAGVNDPCEKDVLFRDEVPGNLRKIVSLNNNPTSPPTPAPKTKANLKIKSITVKESGSSKSINVYSGQVLTLESGKSYEFKTTIENNGGTTANNVNYQLLFSESHNYTNPKTAVYPVSSNNINSISANSSSSSTERLYVSDNIASLQLRSGMAYYLTYDINLNRKVEESNYNDNYFTFNFNYIKPSKKSNCFDCEMLEPYKVQVFDFNGQRVLSKQVSSEAEERLLLSQLPKNRYIVKKKETTIKVNN